MKNLADFQYPPPKNWQNFESLCHDLWKKIWNDPNAQKNGRSGQEQHGVDVYGSDQDTWIGVQCKGKDNYSNKNLTITELVNEVDKAKKFTPLLSNWIIATTCVRDAKIQQKARELTEQHQIEGLFTVSVWAWEDIVEALVNYPDLITKHLPQVKNLDEQTVQKIDKIDEITKNILKKSDALETIPTSFAQLEEKVIGIQNIKIQDILTPEYNAEIDDIRDLVTEGHCSEAIKAFERLKKRIWHNASKMVRFRILTNLGSAYYRWGKLEEAGSFFIEAHQYNPDDEISLTNLAIAHSFQSDFENTEKTARRILGKNPGSINGYSILLQIPPYNDLYDQALDLVPQTYQQKPFIAYCLGLVAQNSKRFDLALEWFEIALQKDTENNPDFKAGVAQMLMQSIWSIKTPLLFGQIEENEKNALERAIQLLTEAWNQIKNTNIKEVHPVWLLNRGIAKKLLGNNDEAYDDIKTAYEIKSSDPEFAKHLAIINLKKGDTKVASEILEKYRENQDVPEISIILADIYISLKESKRALVVIQDFLKWNKDKQLKFLSYRSLVDIYIELKDEANAINYSNRLLTEFPEIASTYVSVAQLLKMNGKVNEAIDTLLIGKKNINSESHITDLVELADELFDLKVYHEAADCYESIADIQQDVRFTLMLLASYYNAGILSKALNLCCSVREKLGILPKHTEIEIAILEEINELDKSKNLANQYLQVFPNSLSVKLRLARLNFLLGSFDELDNFLNEERDLLTISLDDGLTISSLLAQRHRFQDSFNLMYELRRKHFQNSNAHSFYITNFFFNEKFDDYWLHSEVVKEDFAFCIVRIDGNKEWYLVENRIDADFHKREFKPTHPFIKEAIGKKVGDSIQIKKSNQNEEYAEIIEIKSKYVFALHESTNLYETMFPESNDFWSFNIKDGDNKEEDKTDLTKIKSVLAARSKRINESIRLYQTSNLPIGLLAKSLGLNGYETWRTILLNNQGLTFCSNGNETELNNLITILSHTHSPKLVADITSIHLAYELGVADKIVSEFGKLLIAPTMLFSLYRKLEELGKNRFTGIFSIREENGYLYKNEFTPDDIENHFIYLTELIKWIECNCLTTAHKIGFDIERGYKARIRDALLPEFFDTSLIVEDHRYLLFSEDERLRSVSFNELGTLGVWMQPILISLNNRKAITEEEYVEILVKLASSNITHIHFDEKILAKAAQKSNWLLDESYKIITQRLKSNRAETNSALNVAVNFLFELYNLPIPDERWQALVIDLLSNLCYDRNQNETLKQLKLKVRNRFRLLPLEEENILQTIIAWEKSRIITL